MSATRESVVLPLRWLLNVRQKCQRAAQEAKINGSILFSSVCTRFACLSSSSVSYSRLLRFWRVEVERRAGSA